MNAEPQQPTLEESFSDQLRKKFDAMAIGHEFTIAEFMGGLQGPSSRGSYVARLLVRQGAAKMIGVRETGHSPAKVYKKISDR